MMLRSAQRDQVDQRAYLHANEQAHDEPASHEQSMPKRASFHGSQYSTDRRLWGMVL